MLWNCSFIFLFVYAFASIKFSGFQPDSKSCDAQSCGRNSFVDCHGQTPAIILADFECNDEVSRIRGKLYCKPSGESFARFKFRPRLDVRCRSKGR